MPTSRAAAALGGGGGGPESVVSRRLQLLPTVRRQATGDGLLEWCGPSDRRDGTSIIDRVAADGGRRAGPGMPGKESGSGERRGAVM